MSKLHAIEMEKSYDPKTFEKRIYEEWEKNGQFKPKEKNSKKNFVIPLPPPNVTGVLHIGHALDHALQDILIRYHRMCGDTTFWIPGTDHAGIATQNVVERKLKEQGIKRTDLGREAFVEKCWQVKEEHHRIITEQMKQMGDSPDWERERFTLDEGLSKAVCKVFVDLYNKNLIYRGNYLVNYCTRCGTALADDEVEHSEKNGFMYRIYYRLADGATLPDGSDRVLIATTRPETMLADTAIAVHPEDERYKSIIGKYVILPLVNKKIPVVADTYVDREFGTGVVKITPAHDPNDWEVGQRHNLEIINMLNKDGTLNELVPEKYRGLTCEKARDVVIADLEAQDLFAGKDKIKHSVGECYRCKTTIQPFLSKQWFVKMKPLAEKALNAWKKGEIEFYPKKWENTYSHWLENIRDWCISRQLWWGHRIPVWYCDECGTEHASETPVTACKKCGSQKLSQDPDVLDTWFSSWLWPFSALGWPEKTESFKQFYPTTTLVTGYDILFFWVSRMIMAGLEFTGQVPFKHVNIHGLVRDKQGRKMSKSLGNGVDPLEVIRNYGADALKFTLSFMCAQGQDVLIDEESFKFGSKFANKLWNASRYILSNLEGREILSVTRQDLTEPDLWILHSLNETVKNVREALESYRYNDSAQAMYEFFWNDFCDWYVETTKIPLKNGTELEKDKTISVLLSVLEETLRLIHPHVPFVTEEIYSKLPKKSRFGATDTYASLITADFPQYSNERICKEASLKFSSLQEIVKSIRTLRTECGIEAQVKLNACLFVKSNTPAEAAKDYTSIITTLSGLSSLKFLTTPEDKPAKTVGAVGSGFEVFIIADGEIDVEKILARFDKELLKEKANVEKLESKLNNKNFIENAPKEIIEKERNTIQEKITRIEKLNKYKNELSSR